MYLYLTSNDLGGYHVSNTGDDFTVSLPASYYFSRTETWCLGLVDLLLVVPPAANLAPATSEKIVHVCCDAVEPSVYNGGERKLLTATRIKDCVKTANSPVNIRYVPLSQERLSTLRVYLRYDDGTPLSVVGLTSYCTLHVKRTAV